MTTETRRQFGILFGFVGAFILVFICYGLMWRLYNKREEKMEAARQADLIERGFGSGQGEFEEKGKERGELRDVNGAGIGGQGAAGTISTGAGSG
jgi:hypothetical protein